MSKWKDYIIDTNSTDVEHVSHFIHAAARVLLNQNLCATEVEDIKVGDTIKYKNKYIFGSNFEVGTVTRITPQGIIYTNNINMPFIATPTNYDIHIVDDIYEEDEEDVDDRLYMHIFHLKGENMDYNIVLDLIKKGADIHQRDDKGFSLNEISGLKLRYDIADLLERASYLPIGGLK